MSANFKALFPAVPMDLCLVVITQNSVKKNFEGSNLKSILSKGLKDRPTLVYVSICYLYLIKASSKARFRPQTFHEPNLIRSKADPKYLDRLY